MSESFKVGEAPWEKQQRTPNSARPSSLSSPVPKDTTSQPTPADAPEAIPVGSAPWENETAQAAPQDPQESDFAPEPGFIQANVQQFENLGDRIAYGLSADNSETLRRLQNKYGPQNATIRKGEVWFRKDATQKFKRIDPDQFEVFADLIPDGARNIIMEAAMLPGEVAGATGAALAGLGAGAPVTVPGGIMAGRVASVPLANAAADYASGLAGNIEDGSRSKTQENVIGMGMEAALPLVGSKMAGMVTKRLPGTAAYQAAKEAAKKEVVALSEMSKGVQESVQRLEKMGLENGLNLYQTQPDSPATKALVMKVADQPEFHKIQMEAAEDVANFTDKLFSDIKRKVNPKGPLPEGNIGQNIKSTITDLDKKEALRIGEFRTKALAKLGNSKQQLPTELSDNVIGLMEEMGFTRKVKESKILTKPGSFDRAAERGGVSIPQTKYAYNFIPPRDIRAIEGRLGLTEGQTRAMVNALNEYGQYISKGNEARLTDVEQLINRLGPMTQKLKGTQGGAYLGKIVGDLRQHRRQIIGDALDKGSYEDIAFNTAMDEFSLIRKNVDDLSAILENDLANDAVVKYFFSQNKSPERRAALKAILGADSHQWASLREAAVDRMMIEHADRTALTRYDATKFFESLKTKYSDEMMRDLFPDKESIDAIKHTFNYIDRFQRYSVGVKADQQAGKAVDAASDALIGTTFGVKFKQLNGIAKLLKLDSGKENALFELYNRDGFHKFIDKYKGPGNKKDIAKKVEYLLMQYNAARAANKQAAQVLDIGKDITKRATRAEIREESMR